MIRNERYYYTEVFHMLFECDGEHKGFVYVDVSKFKPFQNFIGHELTGHARISQPKKHCEERVCIVTSKNVFFSLRQ